MIPIGFVEFTDTSFVDLIVPSYALGLYRGYKISLWNVVSSEGLNGVLTMVCSTNQGVSFDENPVYTDTGFSHWVIQGIGGSYTRLMTNFGLTLAPDTGDDPEHGANAEILFQSPGKVAGIPVHSTYLVPMVTKGELGDLQGRKQVQGFYSGYYKGALGKRVNAWRFRATSSGAPNALIRGLISLQGIPLGVPL